METTDQEIEDSRLHTVEEILETLELSDVSALLEQYGPGTFGCHEALHMASIEMQDVARDLMSHPAIAANPEWFFLAHQAHDALFSLYQAIGAEHMTTDDEPDEADDARDETGDASKET